MTLRVYRLDATTGARTELPHVDPSPVLYAGISQTYPPCSCPRCLPHTGGRPTPGHRDPELP